MAICVWTEYYILSFGTTVKIPFLLPTLSLHSEIIYQVTMNFSSGRGLQRCRVYQTHSRSTVFRLVSLSEMSSDAKGPNLHLFVHVHFMGIRGEPVQLGKLWARNRVTTTNHHSEPVLFFNRELSGFLSARDPGTYMTGCPQL